MLLAFVLLESVLIGLTAHLWWRSHREEPSAPVYPIGMWRTRRDVTVLGPRPFDWTRDDEDGGTAA